MKSLTKDQSNQKAKFVDELSAVASKIREAIAHANAQMDTLFTPIQELEGRYLELTDEARSFLESIHEQQDAHLDDHSDKWRAVEAGQAYKDWAGEWTLSLEDIKIERPEPIEEPEMDAAEALRELSDQPQ